LKKCRDQLCIFVDIEDAPPNDACLSMFDEHDAFRSNLIHILQIDATHRQHLAIHVSWDSRVAKLQFDIRVHELAMMPHTAVAVPYPSSAPEFSMPRSILTWLCILNIQAP
jgi:hypothetical protein